MNSKSTYTLIFLLSFMASMETQGYELQQKASVIDFLKVQVDQKKEDTKKILQSTRALIVKKAYAQAALLKSNIVFFKTMQYKDQLIAQGFDLNSTGTSKNTIKIAYVNLRHNYHQSDYKATL